MSEAEKDNPHTAAMLGMAVTVAADLLVVLAQDRGAGRWLDEFKAQALIKAKNMDVSGVPFDVEVAVVEAAISAVEAIWLLASKRLESAP